MARKGEVKGLDDHRVWDNGNINIVVSSIDEVFRERASAGAIRVPGVICQQISKSCKNKDQ